MCREAGEVISIPADQARAPRADTEHRSQAEVALPCFDKGRPLEPHLAQVELAVLHNDWVKHGAATHLALVLEGRALQVFTEQLYE